ncbi:Trm112 family protein [Thiotrichales bacterium 19S9-12]|nr:Trm112 family protein [Thiotrichales bacterium 19S9-11]MCF6812226.1 Trm112 family protein [Thiotrichales bacterium 19S9-12]
MKSSKIADILACPICKGNVHLSLDKQSMICYNDRLAFPIQNGIYMMLEEEAKELTLEEIDKEKNG